MNTTTFGNIARLQWGFSMKGYPVYVSEQGDQGNALITDSTYIPTTSQNIYKSLSLNQVTDITLKGSTQSDNKIQDESLHYKGMLNDPIVTYTSADSYKINNNNIPVTSNISQNIYENDFLNIKLLGYSPSGSKLTYSIVKHPSNGSVSLPSIEGNITYTPTDQFIGQDTFTYKCADQCGLYSNISTITILVNNVNPATGTIFSTVNTDNTVNIDLIGSSPANYSLQYFINDKPMLGIVTIDEFTGKVTYISGKYPGLDSFTYYCKDSKDNDSNISTVYVTVYPINPITADVTTTTTQCSPINIILSGTSVIPLTYYINSGSGPSNGTLSNLTGNTVTYTSNKGYIGSDSFSYYCIDSQNNESNTSNVNINIKCLPSYITSNAPTNVAYGGLAMSSSGTYQITSTTTNNSQLELNNYTVMSELKEIFVSIDFGKNWKPLTSAPNFKWIQTIVSNDGTIILALNNNGNVYISNDGGNSFNLVSCLTNVNVYSITMTDDGTKLAVGCYQDYVYVSTNSGLSWTKNTSLGILINTIVKYNYSGSCIAIMSYNIKLNNYILNYYNNYHNTENIWNSITCETNVFGMSGNDNSIIYAANKTNIIQIYTYAKLIFLLNNPSPTPLTIIAANGDGSIIVVTNGTDIYKSSNYGESLSIQKSPTNSEAEYKGIALDSDGGVQSSTFDSDTRTIGGILNYGTQHFITLQVVVTTGVLTLPILGINVSVSIDWGDCSGMTIETSDLPTYTYRTLGTYTISIYGEFTHFGSSNITSDYNTGLQSFVLNNKIESLISMSNAFANVYTDFTVDFGNNTSNVIDMSCMFYNCKYFNRSLSNINTSNVTNVSYMFYNASRFNQDLSNLVTNNVTIMDYMLYNAKNFDKDLSSFQIPNLTSAKNMLTNSHLSTSYYDLLLFSFNNQGLKNISNGIKKNVIFCAGNIKYSYSHKSFHDNLINQFGWKIIDGGFTRCFSHLES
jgi:hypothetical protein